MLQTFHNFDRRELAEAKIRVILPLSCTVRSATAQSILPRASAKIYVLDVAVASSLVEVGSQHRVDQSAVA